MINHSFPTDILNARLGTPKNEVIQISRNAPDDLGQRSFQFLLFALTTLVVWVAGTTTAAATCVFVNGETTRNYTFAVPAIDIPRDAAPGKVLYTAMQNALPQTSAFANCSSGGGTANRTVMGGSQVSSTPLTYATNVPGLGIRYFDLFGTVKRYWGVGNEETSNSEWVWNASLLGIEVVVTGPATGGAANGALVGTFKVGTLTIANLHVNTFQVIPTTCSTSALIPVAMPSVSASTLPAVGSTSGSTRFGIQLANCPVAVREIAYQLDAPDGVVNAIDGVFLASTDSTSHGVGLAIKDSSNQPVSLNTRHPLPDFRPAAGAAYRIELSSNYYRTGDVEVGTVNGRLIYTMFYQ
jgi:major type 1 subunit fimbrin (pilin)